jgi:hypothetical protein
LTDYTIRLKDRNGKVKNFLLLSSLEMIPDRNEFYFFFINIEASIEISRIKTIIPRERRIGISK